MKFYLFSFLYIFVFLGSIYGVFVSELSLPFGLVLEGWRKNLLCGIGLFLIGVVSAYPVLLALRNALSLQDKQEPK